MTFSRYPQQNAKTEMVCQRLYALACEKGPHGKLPPTRDLVELFQTSQTTLFEAITILEGQDILLRKQGSGIFVSPHLHRKNFCILLYPHLFLRKNASPFWGMLWGFLAQETERRMAERNEHYTFHLVPDPAENGGALPADMLKSIQNKRLHGLLTIGSNAPTYAWFTEQQIPCVTYAGWSKWQVAFDTRAALHLSASYFAQHGVRRPAFWQAVDPYDSETRSNDFIHSSLSESGYAFDPALVQNITTALPASTDLEWLSYQEQGYRLVHTIFGDPTHPKPDGLFIGDDMLTWGALLAFQELGIKIGRDLQLASFANRGSPTLFGYQDKIAILEYDPAQLVQTLFTFLDTVVANPHHETCALLLQPTFRAP